MSAASAGEVRVGAVVVTYRRPDVVMATVAAVLAQTRPPDRVVVVDNDADAGLAARLAEAHPAVEHVAAPGNAGYAAGLADGMAWLGDRDDPDWFWLLDDDTPPVPDHLETGLAVALGPRRPWVVARRGGRVVRGRVAHGLERSGGLAEAGFTHVDGSLVSRDAVAAAGLPRRDLFMMFEDIEYTTRVRRAGGTLLVLPGADTALHLGSGGAWRAYYQSRNHLRTAIDHRSAPLALAWVRRTAGLLATDVVRRRWDRPGLRLRGAVDALRGRMGRTVEPTAEGGRPTASPRVRRGRVRG